MSVGFGLLGSGFMAHTYAECLAKHVPDGHLVAVALARGRPAWPTSTAWPLEPDAEALLARDDVEAVIIATPHSTHLPLTRAAAAAGKHVYIEKPMAVTLADCDAMIAACHDAGVLLNVNNVTRHRASPVDRQAPDRRRQIGELRMIRVLSSVIGYLPDDHGWAHKPGEGGAWLDMGVHLFDAPALVHRLRGRRRLRTIRDFAGDEHQRRSGMAELVMRNGVLVQVLISFEMPSPGLGSQSQWTFIGSDGIIESDSYGKVRLGRGDGWEDVYEMPPFALNADVYSPVRLEAFAEQTQEFAVAVQRRCLAPPPALQGADGRAAVEVVEAAAAVVGQRPGRPPADRPGLTPAADRRGVRPMEIVERDDLSAPASPGTRRAVATFPAFVVLADGSLLATLQHRVRQGHRRPDDRAAPLDATADGTWSDPVTPFETSLDGRRGALKAAPITRLDGDHLIVAAPLDRSRGVPGPAAVQPGDRGLPADDGPPGRLDQTPGGRGRRGGSCRCRTTSGRRR